MRMPRPAAQSGKPLLASLESVKGIVDLYRLIRRKEDELRKEKKAGRGRALSGRQTLRLIYEWFLANEADKDFLDIKSYLIICVGK